MAYDHQTMIADMAALRTRLASVNAELPALDAAVRGAQEAYDAAKAALDAANWVKHGWDLRHNSAFFAVASLDAAMSQAGIPLPH